METFEQRRARPPAPGSKAYHFIANAKLVAEIEALSVGRNRSSVIRKLLWLGLEQYKMNKLEGNTTGKKHKDAAARRKAEAEAKASRREAEKKGLEFPSFVPSWDEEGGGGGEVR